MNSNTSHNKCVKKGNGIKTKTQPIEMQIIFNNPKCFKINLI